MIKHYLQLSTTMIKCYIPHGSELFLTGNELTDLHIKYYSITKIIYIYIYIIYSLLLLNHNVYYNTIYVNIDT